MSAFSIPLSGLSTSSDELDVIANNLANLNTYGYKDESLTFGDIFNGMQGTSGSGDPIQYGAGVEVDSTVSNFSNGTPDATGVDSNMALQGNGMFVVEDPNGQLEYTRAGDFTTNAAGQLVTPAGQLVMGFPAVNGVVNTNAALAPISVSQAGTIPGSATTNFQLNSNLNADAAAGTTYSEPITVYDSLGNPQTLSVNFTADGPNASGQNTWSYNITLPGSASSTVSLTGSAANLQASTPLTAGETYTITDGTNTFTYTAAAGSTVGDMTTAINDASSGAATAFTGAVTGTLPAGVTASINAGGNFSIAGLANGATATDSGATTGTMTAAPTTISAGTLTFNSTGALTSVTPTTTGQTGTTGNVTGITIPGLADGASTLNLTWDLGAGSATPAVTQLASASTTNSTEQNGYAVGTLTGYSVLSDGTVEGQFSNNQTLALGQVAVANFANVQGLQETGDNSYIATASSGAAVVGQAGSGSLGTIVGGSVEESNVNLSTEFSNMIVAQQAYEANAKVLTTMDQVSQATIQLIS